MNKRTKKIWINDPVTDKRKLVSRDVLASACRLSARKHDKGCAEYYDEAQEPEDECDEEYTCSLGRLAQGWWKVGEKAGLSHEEMTDALTGANGAFR